MDVATVPGGQPGKRPRDRKQQIIRAATRLMRQRGYDAVGVDEVAAAVGITGPALYRHFRNKQELLQAVVFAAMTGWEELVDRDRERSGPAGRSLAGLLGEMAVLSVDQREFGVLWQRESRHLADDDRLRTEKSLRSYAQAVATRIRQTRPSLDEPDADLLAWSILSVLASLSYHHAAPARARLERLVLNATTGIAKAVLPRGRGHPPAVAARPPAPTRVSRREALLTAAVGLFDQRGYQAVSIEEIGAAAGVAAPSVYRHFTSKSDLLYAALMRGAEALHMSVAQVLGAAGETTDTLRRVVRAYVAHTVDHAALSGVLIREAGNLPEEQGAALVRTQRDYVAEWVRLLTAEREGLPGADARVLVHAVFSVVTDAARTPHLRVRPRITDELTTLANRILFTPLAG